MSATSDSEYERAKANFEAAQAHKKAERRKKKEAEKKAEEARKAAEIAAAAERRRVEVAIRVDKRGKDNGGRRVGRKIIPDSESELESGVEQVFDSDKETADRRCTVCVRRNVPCIWNKVRITSSSLENHSNSFRPENRKAVSPVRR